MDFCAIVSTSSCLNLGMSTDQHQRSLGAVIILTLSWLSEELRRLIPDIDNFQTLAIENIRPWAVSSLLDVLSILEEIRRKTRLRARV